MDSSSIAQDVTAYFDSGMTATTVYLTVLTGYLVAAYLVGSKLTRVQLMTISILFVVFALMFAFGTYGFFGEGISLAATEPGGLTFPVIIYLPSTIFFIEIAGILAAINFMYSVRSK